MGVQEDLEVATRIAHVRPLGSLAEKVKPAHTALLVVDMQNDFCAPGGLISKDGRDITAAQALGKRLPAFIDTARDAGVMIVFIRCVYTSERNFYLSDVWLEQAARKREGGYTRIPVCRDGEWEGDFFGDVLPQPSDAVVSKHRYNAFHNTNLDLILRSNGIRTVLMTGVVTNVCVETTAREAFVRDYYVVAVDDGCAAYVEADHIASLSNIDRFFGQVATIKQISALWRERADTQIAAE
jgi:ureidoacrylate peracid hydrolase